MNVLLSSAVVAALAVGIGTYFTKRAEFRREQRLKAYAEFVRSFLDVALSGAYLHSVCFTYGPPYDLKADDIGQRGREAYKAAFDSHAPHRANFAQASAFLRMVGSEKARAAADVVEEWLLREVHSSPPFDTDFKKAGPLAKTGPAAVERGATPVAHDFTQSVCAEF